MTLEGRAHTERDRATTWGELVLRAPQPAVVARTNREGWPVVYANPAFARRLGVRIARLLGRSLWSLNAATGDAARCVQTAVQAGERVSCVVRLDERDGRFGWFEATYRPLLADDGTVTHVLVTHEELTRTPIAA